MRQIVVEYVKMLALAAIDSEHETAEGGHLGVGYPMVNSTLYGSRGSTVRLIDGRKQPLSSCAIDRERRMEQCCLARQFHSCFVKRELADVLDVLEWPVLEDHGSFTTNPVSCRNGCETVAELLANFQVSLPITLFLVIRDTRAYVVRFADVDQSL